MLSSHITLFGLILENSQLYENSEQESKSNKVYHTLHIYIYLIITNGTIAIIFFWWDILVLIDAERLKYYDYYIYISYSHSILLYLIFTVLYIWLTGSVGVGSVGVTWLPLCGCNALQNVCHHPASYTCTVLYCFLLKWQHHRMTVCVIFGYTYCAIYTVLFSTFVSWLIDTPTQVLSLVCCLAGGLFRGIPFWI